MSKSAPIVEGGSFGQVFGLQRWRRDRDLALGGIGHDGFESGRSVFMAATSRPSSPRLRADSIPPRSVTSLTTKTGGSAVLGVAAFHGGCAAETAGFCPLDGSLGTLWSDSSLTRRRPAPGLPAFVYCRPSSADRSWPAPARCRWCARSGRLVCFPARRRLGGVTDQRQRLPAARDGPP
jgi:hypothetical protein